MVPLRCLFLRGSPCFFHGSHLVPIFLDFELDHVRMFDQSVPAISINFFHVSEPLFQSIISISISINQSISILININQIKYQSKSIISSMFPLEAAHDSNASWPRCCAENWAAVVSTSFSLRLPVASDYDVGPAPGDSRWGLVWPGASGARVGS